MANKSVVGQTTMDKPSVAKRFGPVHVRIDLTFPQIDVGPNAIVFRGPDKYELADRVRKSLEENFRQNLETDDRDTAKD